MLLSESRSTLLLDAYFVIDILPSTQPMISTAWPIQIPVAVIPDTRLCLYIVALSVDIVYRSRRVVIGVFSHGIVPLWLLISRPTNDRRYVCQRS